MKLDEYLKLNKPKCISVLLATKNGKTISPMYTRDEYTDVEVMSKVLLNCEVMETKDEDDCVEIYVARFQEIEGGSEWN